MPDEIKTPNDPWFVLVRWEEIKREHREISNEAAAMLVLAEQIARIGGDFDDWSRIDQQRPGR